MKIYKKIISLLISVLCIITIISCENIESPIEVVNASLSQLQQGNGNEFLDKAIKDIVETKYCRIEPETRDDICTLYKDMEYNIISEEIIKEENRAIVCVEAVLPDITLSMGLSLRNAAWNSQYNSMSSEEKSNINNTYIRNGFNDISRNKTEIEIFLSKEEGKWILDENKESLIKFIGTLD